jgi:iron complex outermembrane recepter protein
VCHRFLVFLCLLLGSVNSNLASAEEKLQPVPIAEVIDEDVVVLAQRQSRSALLTQLASSTQLSLDEIFYATIDQTAELARRVPNLNFVEAGDRRTGTIGIRGLNGSTYGEPTVVAYVDDVPVNDLRLFSLDLYDVEQITVLRGPHAETTHGASAEAGLIQINTIQPGKELDGYAFASYGNFDAQIYRAAVGAPIVKDKLMFRISGMYSRRDGYVENDFLNTDLDDRNFVAGRLQLLWLPAEEFDVRLTLEGDRADDGGQTYIPLSSPDPFEVNFNENGSLETNSNLLSLRIAYTLPEFKFVSITSRRDYESDDHSADLDFTPTPAIDLSLEYDFVQWSQEFRISSGDTQGWNWTVGSYIEDRQSTAFFGFRFEDTDFIRNVLLLPFSAPVLDIRDNQLYHRSMAIFGEATLPVADKFELTFGLRLEYRHDEMEAQHALIAADQNARSRISTINESGNSKVVLPKIAGRYAAAQNISVYASAGAGWRPGGFADFIDDPRFVEWDPEYLWNFECGIKSNWLQNRISLNASVYNTLVTDLQVRRINNLAFRVDNAEQASSRGMEVDFSARPLTGFEFSFGLGYAAAEFDDYTDAITRQKFDGNELVYASKYTYSIAGEYHSSIGLIARIEFLGRSKYAFNEENTAHQPGFGLLNAKIGYETKRFGVYLFGKNLTDRQYSHFGILNPDNTRFGAPGEPRTFGIQAVYKF